MTAHSVYLSSKQALIQSSGYACLHDREARYERRWHSHDCAMLLWPQTGSLVTAWAAEQSAQTATLTRNTALLLPAGTAHQTLSGTARQRHGELYLASDLLRPLCTAYGALQLDGAAVAMLDALLHPAARPQGAEHLVRAIMAQVASAARPAPVAALSPPQQMLRGFALALEQEGTVATIDAVAARLGISVRQLQRACQQEWNLSPVAVRRLMVARHARMLLAEGLSLSAVSVRLGFANSGHLGRLLRGVDTAALQARLPAAALVEAGLPQLS
jgi:AraC-like DNA-binding protein